jgi:hypothetical protein
MATRLLPPGYQEFLPTGAIAPGAKLYTYSAGTSNPKETYADAALTVPNANPVVADASGRFGDIFAGVGDYRVVMNTSADTLLWTADPVDGASSAGSGINETNLVYNGDFRVNSPLPAGQYGYFSDTQPCAPGWLALSQSGTVQVRADSTVASRWAADVLRLNIRTGSQRYGVVQWVLPEDCAHLAAQSVAFSARVQWNGVTSGNVRYAIIQWASYPTDLPADPVADWTSTTYSSGAFFTSNVAALAVGVATANNSTYIDLPAITGVCSSNPQAIGVIIWTESATTSSRSLKITNARLTQGTTVSDFQRRHYKTEKVIAQPDPFLAQRNLAVNGDFNVWQGGATIAIPASTTTTACYGPDRWCMETDANQACTISRIAGTAATRTAYGAKIQRNAGQTGTSVLRFQQALETADLYAIRDRQLTASFLISAGSDFAGSLTFKVLAGTGTEGRRTNAAAYTGETTIISGTLADLIQISAGSEQYFSFTSTGWGADIPVGVGDFTQACICWEWTPSGTAGADDSFNVFNVRLHIGDSSAPFVVEDIGETLARCQRWYSKSFPQATAPAQNAGVTGAVSFPQVVGASTAMTLPAVTFPATMRAAPVVTLFNPSAANAEARNVGTGTDCTLTSATATEWGFSGTATTPGGSAAGQQLIVHYTADARL